MKSKEEINQEILTLYSKQVMFEQIINSFIVTGIGFLILAFTVNKELAWITLILCTAGWILGMKLNFIETKLNYRKLDLEYHEIISLHEQINSIDHPAHNP